MREKLLMDRGWRFALGHAANPAMDFEFAHDRSLVKAGEARGAAGSAFDDKKWRIVHLPHDWAIEQSLDPQGDKDLCDHGFYSVGPDHPESSVGWYRRMFNIPKSDLGRRISVEFDGVFRDSIVWINGHRIGRHASGCTSFRYDLTDYLHYGEKNVIVLRADATQYEGWYYEGAGIHRHVWLTKTAPLHVGHWGTFVTTELIAGKAVVTVRTMVCNESDDASTFQLQSEIHGQSPQIPGHAQIVTLQGWETREFTQQIDLPNPKLWSCDEPNLYELKTLLVAEDHQTLDTYRTPFGVRTFAWDAKRGFFLNGKPLKIKGMCLHRDHAGVGTALPDRLHEFRIEKLKEMGVNAFRASHYPHAPEILDACDRLGLLVMAENRLSGSSPEQLGQLESLIRRDRNHPSIFLWSLANEEHTIQWKIAGERIGKTMVRLCHTLDPTRKVTTAMHDKGLGTGFANVVDVHGWNYMRVGDLEAYHKKHPQRLIIGSEESSVVCTRGIYTDDPARGYVRAYDERTPGWGTTAEKWWKFFSARDWLAGGFVWIGFDHRGEPIPYKWPCTTSHFGLMDLCGFPKDNYYYYKSWWTHDTTLHLFPHWNWPGQEGREIDVRCFSNCDEVELSLNGQSLGKKKVERNSHVAWKVVYTPGVLVAHGYRGGKRIAEARRETTGVPKSIALSVDRETLRADGEDVASVTVSVVDDAGRAVPTADNLIRFEVTGAGHLLGVGNGNPSSHEHDKAPFRRLFSGLALALIQSKGRAGKIELAAHAEGLISANLVIGTKKVRLRPAVNEYVSK